MNLRTLIDIYPGETVYSWLSRLWKRSGICGKRDFLKEIYGQEGRTYPSLFFIGKLDKEFIDFIKPVISYKKLLFEHTLFKYYVRFLDLDRRKEVYEKALNNENGIENLVPVEMKKKGHYYLRYCPLCAKEDREKYGEAYFRVEHAFPRISICSKHKCELINTDISGIGYRLNTFRCLEDLIVSMKIVLVNEKDIRYRVAKFIKDLFSCGLDMQKDIKSGDYLTSRLNSKYIKKNYGSRDNALLVKDLKEFYQDINDYKISVGKLQAILLNKTWNAYDLCLVALFEGIKPKELAAYDKYTDISEVVKAPNWKALDDSYTKQFNELAASFSEIDKVSLDKKWICKRFNLEYLILIHHFPNLVKALSIIKGKKRDWKKLDDEYCKRLNELYRKKKYLFIGRVITFEYVGSLIGVKDKSLRRLPNLMNEVREIEVRHSIRGNARLSLYLKKIS